QRILDEADELAQTKTWRAILGDLASPRALVRDLRDKFHHLMPEAEALALLEKATGIKPPAPSEPPPPIDAKARREATLDARADELAEERAWQEVIAKATAHPADLPFWRFLAALALDAIDFAGDREVLGAVAERRGIDLGANDPGAQLRQLRAHLEELKQAELKAFVVELLAQHIGGGAWAPEGGLARAARFLGVDLAKLRAAARKKVRAEDAKAAQTDRSQAAGHPSGTPEGPAGALAVPCPTCLREAGRACAAKTGKADLAKPHKARVALAAEDRCAGCGCTASIPCETDSGPCGWSAPGLCSECDAAAEAIVEELELGAREPDALVEHLTGLEYEEERIRKQIERLRRRAGWS
ncbi:MAG: hypothetical protein IT372_42465, partial [Polyangiaceae bacterium]|nr:hypothetical protein [Polyangiaceae bacterium]